MVTFMHFYNTITNTQSYWLNSKTSVKISMMEDIVQRLENSRTDNKGNPKNICASTVALKIFCLPTHFINNCKFCLWLLVCCTKNSYGNAFHFICWYCICLIKYSCAFIFFTKQLMHSVSALTWQLNLVLLFIIVVALKSVSHNGFCMFEYKLSNVDIPSSCLWSLVMISFCSLVLFIDLI